MINPIIGYSHNNQINTNNLLTALEVLLNDKAEQIHYAVENEIVVTTQVQEKWKDLLPGKKSVNQFFEGDSVLLPVVKTE